MSRKLAALVALANRPGTAPEGALARERAQRLAAAQGLAVVELRDGTLMVTEEFHADLLRALARISGDGPEPGLL